MPTTITGNPFVHPAQVLHDLIRALGADGVIDDQTGEPGPLRSCADSGNQNGAGNGGNQVLVTTYSTHGLNPGDGVKITGTGLYDGTWQAEPVDVYSFLLTGEIDYSADTDSGAWSVP